MQLQLWVRLEDLKVDYGRTVRAKTLVKDQLQVWRKGRVLEEFRELWDRYRGYGQPWMGLRVMAKGVQAVIKRGKEQGMQMYMQMVKDTIQMEYEASKDIFHTSNNIFCVFNDINTWVEREMYAHRFHQLFEEVVVK